MLPGIWIGSRAHASSGVASLNDSGNFGSFLQPVFQRAEGVDSDRYHRIDVSVGGTSFDRDAATQPWRGIRHRTAEEKAPALGYAGSQQGAEPLGHDPTTAAGAFDHIDASDKSTGRADHGKSHACR